MNSSAKPHPASAPYSAAERAPAVSSACGCHETSAIAGTAIPIPIASPALRWLPSASPTITGTTAASTPETVPTTVIAPAAKPR